MGHSSFHSHPFVLAHIFAVPLFHYVALTFLGSGRSSRERNISVFHTTPVTCSQIYLSDQLAVVTLQVCSFACCPGDGSIQGSRRPELDDSSGEAGVLPTPVRTGHEDRPDRYHDNQRHLIPVQQRK